MFLSFEYSHHLLMVEDNVLVVILLFNGLETVILLFWVQVLSVK